MTAECGTAKHSHGKVRPQKSYTFCSLSPITQIDYFSVQIMSRLNAAPTSYAQGKALYSSSCPVQPPPPYDEPSRRGSPSATNDHTRISVVPLLFLPLRFTWLSKACRLFLPSATTLSSKVCITRSDFGTIQGLFNRKIKTDTNAIARDSAICADRNLY